MYKSQKAKATIVIIFLFINAVIYSQTDSPPSITAQGRQVFCPGSSINIVTDFSITDPDDTTVASFFIQISSGYQLNFDRLELTGNHPNILPVWNNNEGKLTLTSASSTSEMLFSDLENAVKSVVFTTTATDVILEKSFSLSIDNANYLPLTDHFYEFISAPNITWSNAKVAAETRTYFGRQGYLATLTSQEESDFAGKQASGTGWIGGSDEETEGVWKWVTGPEAGTIFWNGTANGSSPNFAYWNSGEPNDDGGGEDYAHITDVRVARDGRIGSWNDLRNEGGTTAEYESKGYIVEYGVPTDSPLNIVASTSIYIPQIASTTEATICESGIATISAIPSEGIITWYDLQTGGNILFTGNDFTTPIINSTTTYYASISINGCNTFSRTPVTVTVNQKPTIVSITEDLICSGTAILRAAASAGDIKWYDSLTSTTPIFIGNSFTTPILNTTTTYYIEADDSNCISNSRTEVRAVVDATIPDFDVSQTEYVLCDDLGSLELETINALGNYNYVWTKEGAIITGDLSSITITEPGNYAVKAISSAGCESLEKNILVTNSTKAIITNDDIVIIDDTDNNSIEVINNNLGIGEYEFSLDDEFGIYKNEGFFQNIATGFHTLYIKDKNGCGITTYNFSILAFPKFFTPNGDGKNDFWKINGFDSSLFTLSDIYIYNRFGILLHKIDINSGGWDGRYQGKVLSSNTYWFRVILTDVNGREIEKKGSLSLIRN